MSHKKLQLKGINPFNKENQYSLHTPHTTYLPTTGREFLSALRHTSTPIQSVKTPAPINNEMHDKQMNFVEKTKHFMSQITTASDVHEEHRLLAEYEAKLSSYLINIETNIKPLVLENAVLDLSMPNSLENAIVDPSSEQSAFNNTEPLNLTSSNVAESSDLLVKRPASEEVEQPASKIFMNVKAIEERAIRLPIATPRAIPQINCTKLPNLQECNTQTADALKIYKLPPTPAASPSGNSCVQNRHMTATPTTTRVVKTPAIVPVKRAITCELNTSTASCASSVTSERLESAQHQFAPPQHNRHNSAVLNRNNKFKGTPQQPITKVCLSMSDEIQKLIEENTIVKNGVEMIVLGPNGTTAKKELLFEINWAMSGPAITRKILMVIFDRDVLATHTLSGKPSPAFLNLNKPEKGRLDPAIVSDLMHFMTNTKDMSSREIRNAITTKCADEFKMLRQREFRRDQVNVEPMQ